MTSKLLKMLYMIQSKSGHEEEAIIPFLEKFLSEIPGVSYETIDKNIYITKGEHSGNNFPCIVAHLD